ncbi:MAG TPA: DUF5684 domain-containing protein [Candidatus Dojkabacteria bacterium]|nr:DUF5684 domain-containing protein [Candidatus Dojkabacteria bacterium]
MKIAKMLLSLFVAFVSVITAVAFIAPQKAMAQTDDYYTTDYEDYDWESYYDDYSYDDYTYDYTDEDAAAALLGMTALSLPVIIASVCVGLVFYAFSSIVYMTIGKKLKEENTWMAWVPVLNMYYMTKISGLNPWLFLLFFVPIANIVMIILTTYKIGLRRGFESWVGLVGGLGIFIPIVYYVFLGYMAWGEPSKPATTA